MGAEVILFIGEALSKYGFPEGHPFSVNRQGAPWSDAQKQGLDRKDGVRAPRSATGEELLRFRDDTHVRWVEACSGQGSGFIDYGDTPAFPGVFEAGASVAGTALEGLRCIMAGEANRTFQPVGGRHHSRRDRAAGFCVFNDVEQTAAGKMMVFGGGGYDLDDIASAWTAVLPEMTKP